VTSQRQTFWEHDSFALVGHTGTRPFPKLTYKALKQSGKTVYAVDPSIDEIEGDRTFADLGALPTPVEAVVLELPKEETAARVGSRSWTTGMSARISPSDGIQSIRPASSSIRRNGASRSIRSLRQAPTAPREPIVNLTGLGIIILPGGDLLGY